MTLAEEKFIKGRLIVTIFHNETNLYSVLKIRVEETSEPYEEKEAVVTGYFPRIHEEESYIFYGKFQEHPRYGVQFHSTHFQKELPKSKQGLIHYLSSELFKGIGKKTAETIVETLGENAISKILEQPSILATIPKLTAERAEQLYKTLLENQGLEKILISLNHYGFGPQLSMRIYQIYKEQTLTIIESNPYKLVEDVEGIGFGRADELGAKLNIKGNHPDRIKAGCLYTLQTVCLSDGHCYLARNELISAVKNLLEANQPVEILHETVDYELLKLEEEGKIITEDDRIYIPSIYFSEKGLVKNIKRILAQTEYENQFPESEFLLALGNLEDRLQIQYALTQKEAIQTALMSPMLILTGGPGTGKTTVIKGIVELYSELHGCSLNPKDYKKEDVFPFLLAAPTGRAAKRMTESTGLPAVTIHRLLGWNGSETFDHDEDNPIEGKILIVDEMSMVDIWLAHNLFKAIPDQMQVILVGDEDQLPSVGPGQVLKDLLMSEKVPTIRLNEIYRQASGSSIIDLAHSIKNGIVPIDLTAQQKDRSFIACNSNQIGEVIKQIITKAINKGYTPKDIQVLAPMYRGPAGIDYLNQLLQEILNSNESNKKREIKFGDIVYRVGDKVLQLINQPEKNIFNGDIGEVVAILYAKENEDKQDQLIVNFEGNEVTYLRQDLNQITLAYCCSIHKAQGSEFPVVLLPVVKGYYRMLRRNLFYTAVTRSKQILIICGEADAFKMAVNRTDDNQRNTTLTPRLLETLKTNSFHYSSEEPQSLSIEEKLMNADPMIGMENITPYDFLEKSS
ncbi:ATP-dependent RecD-like DNA helicase [Bacillus kwashiorkori]|uniref:SF1B family DNA helicase RecD2 n=1 Tax=Bacillus kwashiorkori TaxID=1522318 RepID=UPI0007837FE9|nr:ATP-dependent RecD-like DNA helicase [Bacillus kwashiorkori]